MCTDMDRRTFLKASGAVLLAASAVGTGPLPPARASAGSPLSPGLVTCRCNLHTHGSGSECTGAYDGHLTQALRYGYNAVAFTEHNTTMRNDPAPPFPFTGPRVQAEQGVIALANEQFGVLRSSARSFQTDASLGRVVYTVMAQGAGAAEAGYGAFIRDDFQSTVPFRPYHRPTYVQTPTISVRVDTVGKDAALYVRFSLSWHPAYGSRPAGNCSIEYRFFGVTNGASQRQYASVGLTRIVWIPVPQGVWTQHRLDVNGDIAGLWGSSGPVAGDNAMPRAHFGALSRNTALAKGAFRDYCLDRTGSVDPVAAQASILAAYAQRYPTILIVPGMEISDWHHVGSVGGLPFLDKTSDATQQVAAVHGHGALASYNHPFGVQNSGLLDSVRQEALLQEVINACLPSAFYGADMLEWYPNQRGLEDEERHRRLWDVASRNGLFLTVVSSNDDHFGTHWLPHPNPGYTAPYVVGQSVSFLQQALSAGQAFVGVLGQFGGALDINVGGAPMGSVTVGTPPGQEAAIWADRLPSGSVVELVQGPIDYSGAGTADSGARVVRTLAASAFSGTPVVAALPRINNTYNRVQVRGPQGNVIGMTNPIYCLDREPPNGVPAARRRPPG